LGNVKTYRETSNSSKMLVSWDRKYVERAIQRQDPDREYSGTLYMSTWSARYRGVCFPQDGSAIDGIRGRAARGLQHIPVHQPINSFVHKLMGDAQDAKGDSPERMMITYHELHNAPIQGSERSRSRATLLQLGFARLRSHLMQTKFSATT
jgi:hypothetical protein